MEIIAEGLRFPEGPIAMPDGSVVLVELARGTLSRVNKDGSIENLADLGGGPNGAAVGPDGRIYVCNNGGFDDETDPSGRFVSHHERAYVGGSIQKVNLETGEIEELYRECNGHPLRGPNDIIFDNDGGFWFTDLGKSWPRYHDHGGLYYATPDGKRIREVVYPLVTPNGVGLSPDGSILYVAETTTGRIFQWDVTGPGELDLEHGPSTNGKLTYALPDGMRFDSMAVDSSGYVNVAVLGKGGGICEISPEGTGRIIETGDNMTTNICFGGDDFSTAYITCSDSGTLLMLPWPRQGLKLAFL